ncbi:MAG: hypothetical protein HND56_03880 [Pseudomonadota bacterium]|nr:hypothetical protein [Pseudomonadota bacterium]QKK04881.1 MAG: hypothetical protein HND56_03880 [Pseudomonadota bacterium]
MTRFFIVTAKKYHIADILGVTTGVFLHEGHFSVLRDLDEDVGKAELYRQMPWLKNIHFPSDALQDKSREEKRASIDSWLQAVIDKYGETHMVYPRGQAPAQPTMPNPSKATANPQKTLRDFVRRRKNSP